MSDAEEASKLPPAPVAALSIQPTTPSKMKLMSFSDENLKYVSLCLLTLQNTALVLVMRFTRTRSGDMFMATTSVVCAEVIKVFTALLVIFAQQGYSFDRFWGHLNERIFSQFWDNLKIAVPSLIYVIQNNLLYVAVSNLDAATFQVCYQLKILTTALFSVSMLGKKLSAQQWASLLLLFVGVGLVQLQATNAAPSSSSAVAQEPWKGFTAVIIACFLSGFAGVYFEKVLKGSDTSIWIRNVQLGVIGIGIGLLTCLISDGSNISDKGFFFGYDVVVVTVILLNSLGGLMVAVVVKYADNILKGFATSAAIVLSCIISIYLFDFVPTAMFLAGAGLVMCSVYMYSKFPYAVTPLRSSSKA